MIDDLDISVPETSGGGRWASSSDVQLFKMSRPCRPRVTGHQKCCMNNLSIEPLISIIVVIIIIVIIDLISN